MRLQRMMLEKVLQRQRNLCHAHCSARTSERVAPLRARNMVQACCRL